MKIIKIKPVFEDERGTIWDLIKGEDIQHVGFLKSNKNSIRGKHFHKIQTQYTLVLKGKIKLTSKDLSNKNLKKEQVNLTEMDMICHPPFHYHEIEAIENSELVIFTSMKRDNLSYEEDTFRVTDIDSFVLE